MTADRAVPSHDDGHVVRAGAREVDAPSSVTSRGAVFVVLLLTLVVVGQATTQLFGVLAVGGVALWAGLAVADLPEVRRAVVAVPGLVIGVALAAFIALGWAFLESRSLVEGAVPGVILLVAMVGPGLDLPRAARARGYVLASGFVVVPLASEGDVTRLLTVALWLVSSLVALWLLRRDALSAWTHASPIRARSSGEPVDRLVLVVALALVAATVVALLISLLDIGDWLDGPDSTTTGFGSGIVEDPGGLSSRSGGEQPLLPGRVPSRSGGDGAGSTGGSGSGSEGLDPGSGGTGSGPGGAGGLGGSASEPDSGGGGSAGGSGSGAGESSDGATATAAVWLLVGLALAAAAAGGLFWHARRRGGSSSGGPEHWPVDLAAQLERVGARNGRPRQGSETVVAYARALARGPIPDERLPAVGAVISEGLFGRGPVSTRRRAWAEEVLVAVTTA